MELIAISLLLTLLTVTNGKDNYEITTVNANSRLYFEELFNIRLQRDHSDGHREVQVSIPFWTTNQTHEPCIRHKSAFECNVILREENWENKFQQAPELYEETTVLLNDIQPGVNKNSPRSIIRRMTPSGFVSCFSETFFGTLNNDDADYFRNEID